ncbi:MAG: dihydropteroate synthase [Armatimonadota bacterium]
MPVSVPRILSVANHSDLARELSRLGGSPALAPRAMLRVMRLDGVPGAAAVMLRQSLRAVGGEAVLNDGAMLLIGTEAQYREAGDALQMHPDMAEITEAILAALAHYDRRSGLLRCGRHELPLGEKTYVMGIVNVTPDSFSGDGLGGSVQAAVRRAERMVADGADILDVGGESTRPGAEEVPLEEELRRVVPVIAALAERFPVPISVDTYKSAVAHEALQAGATIVNDISGLRFDPEMAAVVAAAGAAVVVMHIQGTPRTMQQHPHYDDLMTEVCDYLQESTALAEAAGIPRAQVVLDPGFGFGKTVEHNLELLRRLRELTSYGQPILMGTSRKSTIGKVLGDLPPEERLEGTAATVAIAIHNGADIVRVHDVKEMARVAKMTDAIVRMKNEK